MRQTNSESQSVPINSLRSRLNPSKKKIRIDQLMVERGLASDLAKARAILLAGQVVINERRVEYPSEIFHPDVEIRLKGSNCPFVSRGGIKLAGALEDFEIKPKGKVCLDVGTSTGGFTDCLLQHGAVRVYAVDTGAGQIHHRLRQDERVKLYENYNARYLKMGDFPEPIDLTVMDVSFISVKKIIPALLTALRPPWDLLTLVKPQFEAQRGQIGPGGVLNDETTRIQIVEGIGQFIEKIGFRLVGSKPASILGESGNQEYFILARCR